MTRKRVIPEGYITKGRLCPVCGKRTLFVNLIQTEIMECKTCHYRHHSSKANSPLEG